MRDSQASLALIRLPVSPYRTIVFRVAQQSWLHFYSEQNYLLSTQKYVVCVASHNDLLKRINQDGRPNMRRVQMSPASRLLGTHLEPSRVFCCFSLGLSLFRLISDVCYALFMLLVATNFCRIARNGDAFLEVFQGRVKQKGENEFSLEMIDVLPGISCITQRRRTERLI